MNVDLTGLSELPPHMPDVWGEGALFAFSGLDGATDGGSGFVLWTASAPFEFVIETPCRRRLRFNVAGETQLAALTGDALVVRTAAGPLVLAFTAWHTLTGLLPDGVAAALAGEGSRDAPTGSDGVVSEDSGADDAVVLLRRGPRLAVAFGRGAGEAQARAAAGLAVDPAGALADRLAMYRGLPPGGKAGAARLLRKCLSVMRVNHCGPEGVIRQTWSTPDRLPHRWMWLWDSVFHSFAMNRVRPEAAFDDLKSVLEFQRPDGMIPHMLKPDGTTSVWTQPPLLAWGVWENYRYLGDRDRLAWALPKLEAYLEWDLDHRDRNGNGLVEWGIEESTLCRSGESGLDNSPRFDSAQVVDATDFNAELAHDLFCVARIAAELGRTEASAAWRRRAERLAGLIHGALWSEPDGFYFDRDMAGRPVPVRAVSGFLPLMVPGLPAGRAERLAAALRDPATFNPGRPIASTSRAEPTFGTDMWRGPVWVNTNYMTAHGLRLQGRAGDAAWLEQQTVDLVGAWYERTGVLFEFFDALDRTPPSALDRKGRCLPPYDFRKKIHCIRDYHWTAALTFAMLLDGASRAAPCADLGISPAGR